MAASQSTRGSEIYASLRNELDGLVGATVKNLVERNARLIALVPEGIVDEITDYIAKRHAKGVCLETMEIKLQHFVTIAARVAKISI